MGQHLLVNRFDTCRDKTEAAMVFSTYKLQRTLFYFFQGYKSPTIAKLLREKDGMVASRRGRCEVSGKVQRNGINWSAIWLWKAFEVNQRGEGVCWGTDATWRWQRQLLTNYISYCAIADTRCHWELYSVVEHPLVGHSVEARIANWYENLTK